MARLTPERADEIRSIVKAGDLFRAIRIHRSMFPTSNSPIMHETDVGDLTECLYTPLPIFSFCSDAELRELRLRMAVALVSGGFELVPDDILPWHHPMAPKATVHNFFASLASHRNVSDWRRGGVVLRARIVGSCDGPCSACAAAAQGDYALSDLPSIPIRECKNLNTIGCRCIAVGTKFKGID